MYIELDKKKLVEKKEKNSSFSKKKMTIKKPLNLAKSNKANKKDEKWYIIHLFIKNLVKNKKENK